MSKILSPADKQTIYCLDELIKVVNLLSAKGYSGKAIGQALMTIMARFINLQKEPLATLSICIRAIGACVIGDMRSRGQTVDNETVMRAYAASADANVEILQLDDETLKQLDNTGTGNKGSN